MKLKKLLLVPVAMAALASGAWADDATSLVSSTKEYTIEEAVAEGSDFVFSLVNGDGQVLYAPSGENKYYPIDKGNLPDTYNSVGMKLDKTSDGQYTIQSYNQDLSGQLDNWYFQSQPSTGTVIFGWYNFTNHTYGTDGDNLGLWEFQSVDGGGYKLYNVGTGLYLKDAAPAKYSESDAAVWHIYRTIDILADNFSATLETKAKSLESETLPTFYTEINAVNASIANATTYTAYVETAEAALAVATKLQTGINTDWTGVILNSHFTTNSVSAWTITGSSPTVNTTYHNCEYYQKDFDMKQVIGGMKKGTYEISLQAFQRPGWAGTEMFQNEKNGTSISLATLYTTAQSADVPNIYAYAQTTSRNTNNESTTSLDGTTYYTPNGMHSAQVYFDEGLYTVSAKAVVTEDGGDLSFGFKGNLSSTPGAWLIFDNFTLKYISEDVLVDASESQKLLDEYSKLGKYNTELKTSVDAAATALEADLTNGSLYAAFSDLLNQAQSSATAYASATANLAAIEEFVNTTNLYTKDAYDAYYTTPKANYDEKYEAGTLTTDEANAIQSPYADNGKSSDVAVFLTSVWNLTDLNNSSYHVNTWSTEGNTDGSGFTTPFIEYWVVDEESLSAKEVTATLDGLTAGKLYKVTALSRVRIKNSQTVAPTGITMQVGNGEAINVCDAEQIGTSQLYLQHSEVYGTADENGTLTIKYIVASNNNISWLSFKNVMYEEYTPEAETRTSAENTFGTISLPYAFTAEGATLYTVDNIENDYVNLTEAESGAAGAAYIYQAIANEQSFSYKEGALVSTPSTGILTGVFADTKATADTYVLQTQDGVQAFYKVAEGSEPTIGAYRAYLTYTPATEESTEESAAAIRISLNGEVTGIDAVNALTEGKAEIYDLSGRKLNKLQKGVNIVNGVKVIVK